MKNAPDSNEKPPPKGKKYFPPIIDRLFRFIKHIDSNVSSFEDSVGLSNGYLKKVKSPGYEMIATILAKYPQLSERWLRTGQGEMLNNGSLEENIELSEVEVSHETRTRPIPVYEIDVMAGKTSLVNTTEYESIVGWARLPGYEDCVAMVRARGDSMSPVVRSNTPVFVRPAVNKSLIEWGSMYVIVFGGDMPPHPMVKYVRKGPDKDTVILRSENKKYEDMEVPLNDIQYLYPARAGVIDF